MTDKRTKFWFQKLKKTVFIESLYSYKNIQFFMIKNRVKIYDMSNPSKMINDGIQSIVMKYTFKI